MLRSLSMIRAAVYLGCFLQAGASSASGNTNGSCLIQTARVGLQHQSSAMLWSDIQGKSPQGSVVVPAGETWILDKHMDVDTLTIKGTLEWDVSQDDLTLRSGYVVVDTGGHLKVGTKSAPMEKRATIYIKKGFTHEQLGKRVLGGQGTGKIDIHGRQLQRTWTLLSKSAYPGATQLFLKDDPTAMGWRVGDRIGVATTTRGRSTVHTITAIGQPKPEPPQCPVMHHLKKTCSTSRCKVLVTHMFQKTCSQYCRESGLTCAAAHDGDHDCHMKSNITCDQTVPGFDLICECNPPPGAVPLLRTEEYVVHISEPLTDEHWGGHRDVMGRRLEMAAEVVNMERSVLITGDHDDFTSTNEGLHTMITGEGYMDVRYTRVEYCGQRHQMGRYCMHFHLMKQCPLCVFHGNAIVESAQIGITIHGTHNSLVSNNVIWNGRAVGIYTEDGNEMNNVIKQNAIICSWWQECSVNWVSGLAGNTAGIFMIGMTNDVIENRVVGHENCLWTPGSGRGNGHGDAFDKVCPAHSPFGIIRGNVNHDCYRFGIYLDNQFPRKLKRDENGYVTDMASCGKFTADGKDNGIEPANVVLDEFSWHNMYVGQYNMGDIQYVNFTSVNNWNSMYWKSSKNFADGRLWHVKDSLIMNDPEDIIGSMRFLGPGGPHVFGMQNTKFVGGPTVCGALCAGQHCGLGGAAGPCDSQYLLENVDFSEVHPGQRKIAFGVSSTDDGKVLPTFMTTDNSLGGFRSMVSPGLDGFANVPGCKRTGWEWSDAIGCDAPVRRLNVWGRNSGDLKLVGPGYQVAENMAAPVHGMNAGRMRYEPQNGHGYGTPVLVGQRYELRSPSGSFNGDMVLDFSDKPLSAYFGDAHEFVTLNVNGLQCNLHADDDRRFLSWQGRVPRILESHVRIQHGQLRCAAPPKPLSMLEQGPQPASQCEELPGTLSKCSLDGCKVLADGMTSQSCQEFCAESRLICSGAWHATNGTCEETEPLPCDKTLATGLPDLICECRDALQSS